MDRYALPHDASPDTRAALEAVAREHGTPAYAYDVAALERRWTAVRRALGPAISTYYSVKANPSLGLCALLASWGARAEVASLGELEVALAAGFVPRDVLVSGPHKHPALVARLASHPDAMVSVDSAGEFRELAARLPCPLLLRLRSEAPVSAAIALDGRFGMPLAELGRIPWTEALRQRVAGFHVHAGSQFLDRQGLEAGWRAALDLMRRAAETAGVAPGVVDVGGGFGVPYGPGDRPLDLEGVGEDLRALAREATPARVVVELGRYLVAEAGWYLTSVLGQQSRGGRPAVVVDGGTHHRADLCQLGLVQRSHPPLVVTGAGGGAVRPTDVLGCLCLPDDVLAEAVPLPSLPAGSVLAFGRAGAYGLTGAALRFLSHPEPAEVAFAGARSAVLRPRPGAAGASGQRRVGGLAGLEAVGGPR